MLTRNAFRVGGAILLIGAANVAGQAVAPGTEASAPSAIQLARQLNEAFISAAEKVSAAVVVIEAAQKPGAATLGRAHPFLDLLPPEMRRHLEEQLEREEESERENPGEPEFNSRGSGVVIRKNGYILTNSHVVEDAVRIRVRFKNGKEYPSSGVWTDARSDIAVIKIDTDDLAVAELGDSSKTRVGEFAIAIGAPFDLDYSVTFGHISAKGRSHIIPSFGGNSLGASMDQDFLQTDASINPGNSGGPLVNIEGQVIGINTLIRGLRTGIGFAVPINLARTVADQLISDGKYRRAWLGISVQPLQESEMREVVKDLEQGLVVARILPDGPAIKSGLRPSDIIVTIDGRPVASVQELRNATRARELGSELKLDVYRAGKRIEILVKSAEWPEPPALAAQSTPVPSRNSSEAWGMTVQTLTDELAEKFEVTSAEGVMVTGVKEGSAAALKEIRPGDVITAINHQPVRTVREFREAVKAAKPGTPIIVNLISEGAPTYRILKDSGD